MPTASSISDDPSVIVAAAVEGGGTSFKVAVVQLNVSSSSSSPSSASTSGAATAADSSNSNDVQILHRDEIPSDVDPQLCLQQCANFFKRHKPLQGYRALGVACFGPLGLHPHTPTFGRILQSSPKAIWRNMDILSPLVEACSSSKTKGAAELAVMIDTDVNAPALVEYRRALVQQQQQQQQQKQHDKSGVSTDPAALLSSCAYVTVGTGVGVGLVVNGQTVHGRMHPEAGHVLVPALLKDDSFEGYSWGKDACPYFGVNTVEGTTCSVALVERLQQQMTKSKGDGTVADGADDNALWSSMGQGRNVLATLNDDHAIWDHAVNAVASLCVTLLLMVSIERIVIGGGIIQRRPVLLDRIRKRVPVLVNGYLDLPSDMSELIVTSEYGDDAGLYGAIGLAREALLRQGGSDVGRNDNNTNAAAAREEDERRMKQVAFGHGLWHGVLVGGVGTAILFAYALMPLLTRARRR